MGSDGNHSHATCVTGTYPRSRILKKQHSHEPGNQEAMLRLNSLQVRVYLQRHPLHTITGGSGKPAAFILFTANSRLAEVTSAQRSCGSRFNKSVEPAMATIPSRMTSSRSSSSSAAATVSSPVPIKWITVSIVCRPCAKAITSSAFRSKRVLNLRHSFSTTAVESTRVPSISNRSALACNASSSLSKGYYPIFVQVSLMLRKCHRPDALSPLRVMTVLCTMATILPSSLLISQQ